jgi:DNA-binding NarL/FixJ family response regulator
MNTLEILIVTRSIPLADGLDALLKAIPQVDDVQIARSLENAYLQIEVRNPGVVFVDSDVLGNNPKTAMEKIRTLSPKTHRVLLMDDVRKMDLTSKSTEEMLIKGASPSAITSIVTNLLSQKGNQHEHNNPNEEDQSVP